MHLKRLGLILPGSGWVLTESCSQSLVRRFPALAFLELGLSLGSVHDLAPLESLPYRGCQLEILLEAECDPDPSSADEDAELCRLLRQLEHFQLQSLTICVASLTEAQQEQLGQMRHIECLGLELDHPFCEQSYHFPLVRELDVSERTNQDDD